MAEHEVRLDPDDEWECEAFEDFYGYLSTLAARDRRAESEGSLVHQVGQWVTDRVLGPLGPLIAAQPGVVRLRIPRAAAELAHLPWQIAVIDGQPLAALRVTLVTELGEQAAVHESEEGGQLRILALFSLPDGASALDLRQERQDLVRLVRDIVRSTGSDIELQVLQYGATRSRLRAALSEAEGWNVVHISSHGLPSGLLLEDDAGRPDLVSGSELSELLGTTRHKADLVVLSSCESAADARADGDADEEPRHGESTSAEGSRPAPAPAIGSLATHLVDRLDCAVLAMRFPVTDVFARRISTAFYGEVLRERRAVADALGVALRTVGTDELDEAISLLSICTPALFGRRAVDLRLVAPPKEPTSPVERSDLDHPAGWKPLPDHFVGRVSLMARARRALEARSDQVGVALHGMAGVGKTACALELAYTDGEAFQLVVCYQAPGKSVGHKVALINALETIDKRTGARLIDMIDNPSSLAYSVREMTRRMRALFVLDGLDTVLDDRGEWPSEGWRQLVHALGAGGRSKLLLTSRVLPVDLPGMLHVETVHALSMRESTLLAKRLPCLRSLLGGLPPVGSGLTAEEARRLARRTLETAHGHPTLVLWAEAQAGDPASLADWLGGADDIWRHHSAQSADQLAEQADDYALVLSEWTRRAATDLPRPSELLLMYLCCLEEANRNPKDLGQYWEGMWPLIGGTGDAPGPESLVPLRERGLLTVQFTLDGTPYVYDIHPVVVRTIRDDAEPGVLDAVEERMCRRWQVVPLVASVFDAVGSGLGSSTLDAARTSMPYILRARRWDMLIELAEILLSRTQFATGLVDVIAALEMGVAQSDGRDRRPLRRCLLTARIRNGDRSAMVELGDLLAEVLRGGSEPDQEMTAMIALDLAEAHRANGHFGAALEMSDIALKTIDGIGEADAVLVAGARAQALEIRLQTTSAEGVVEEVRRLLGDLPEATGARDLKFTFPRWAVVEKLANVGLKAACMTGQWDRALQFAGIECRSKTARGAEAADVAVAMMNTHLPLAQLGRMPEAWDRVVLCREVFEAGEHWSAYADATRALGELEFQRGHREPAIRLVLEAQRLARRDGSVATLARSYLALSRYEAAAGRAERALSCAVAGVMLARFGDDSMLAEAGRALLVDMMREWPDIPLPAMADAEVAEDIHRNSNSVDPADLFTSVVADAYQRSVEGSAGRTAADAQRRTRRASLRELWRRTRKRW